MRPRVAAERAKQSEHSRREVREFALCDWIVTVMAFMEPPVLYMHYEYPYRAMDAMVNHVLAGTWEIEAIEAELTDHLLKTFGGVVNHWGARTPPRGWAWAVLTELKIRPRRTR